METASEPHLLGVLLDAWDRNNSIVVNLLRAVPEGGLAVRAVGGGHTVAELLTHLHSVRLSFVVEDAPEFALALPTEEWADLRDPELIEQMLGESARAVRDAVQHRVETGRNLDRHFDHPALLLQHLIWHEGYHHGQIKLALKLAGCPVGDEAAGPGTWGVWMKRRRAE